MKMQFSIFFLFFGCITYATCYKCRWTACEGKLMNGDEICRHYGYAKYTGKSRAGGCNWDTEQKFCCTAPPPVVCRWSSCEGLFENGDHTCWRQNRHFTGQRDKSNCKWDSLRFQCCDQTPMSEGCQWVPDCFIESYASRESKCAVSFGAEYMPTRTMSCGNLIGVMYECCPSSREQEENLFIDIENFGKQQIACYIYEKRYNNCHGYYGTMETITPLVAVHSSQPLLS